MNVQLGKLEHAGAQAAAYWTVFVSRWTLWNHVRSAAAFLAAVCFLVGGLMLA